MPGISIVEAKSIIRALRIHYNYNFSNYALTSFRYRIDNILSNHHIRFAEILINRLLEDEEFFDDFLFEISVPSTELFRDPEMWNILKLSIIPQLFKTFNNPVIWFPDAVEGKELYSFLIMAYNENFLKDIKIVVSCISNKSVSQISSGRVNSISMDNGIENFKKVYPKSDYHKFLIKNGKEFFFDNSLFENVRFYKQYLEHQPMPEKSDLIFFRNKFLNYTYEYEENILSNFINNLESGGFLITGNKENINERGAKDKPLQLIDLREKIYKKT